VSTPLSFASVWTKSKPLIEACLRLSMKRKAPPMAASWLTDPHDAPEH
jgi:hypothetical protein